MAEADPTYVDVAAVCAVAGRIEASAQAVDAVARNQLGRLAFDGAAAGRAHLDRGDALRNTLAALTGELARWARASAEIATALRTGAGRYAAADLRAAARMG
jgi:hypothetical protein